MAVPASFNELTQDRRVREHVGDVWYERSFHVPADWKGRRVVLRVGAAPHRSVVWVNGKQVAEHMGGYLPFEADVSKVVDYSKSNRVTIVLNNILDGETLPPGNVKTPGGENLPDYRFQDYQFDFYNYCGLHRPVKLLCMPSTYVDDITVVTDIDGTTGIVDYEVAVAGEAAAVAVRLLDAEGNEAASAVGATGRLEVAEANLWKPGEGYLYTLEVSAADGTDIYRLPVGIRTVAIEGMKFLINGEEFYFRGFGKHEDMDVKGKGLDHAMIIKDFALLKWVGANSFRTSHYPYAEEIYEMADREGIVIIDESPAVGMYIFKGKQDSFNEEALKPLLAHHLDVMEDLVRRDKNHPSVVMWSVSNEAATQEKAFGPYMEKVFAKTRECDPQNRPVTVVVHTWFDNDLAVPYADLICLNRYWGWYGLPGHLDLIEPKAEWELRQWFEHQNKPMILAEYGADTLAGAHNDPPVIFTEEYQVEMVKRINNVLDRCDFICGEHIWNFADFMTKQGISRVMGNKKGAFTRQRQPKTLAHYLRRRWTGVDLLG
jgi:beta-glucuronidase